MKGTDLIEVVRERRSTMALRGDPVPRIAVEELLRLASRAPSALNLQPWEVVGPGG